MALYNGTVWVFPDGDDFGYETGFSIQKWFGHEDDDWSDVEITTYNPETDEEYPALDYEIEQIFAYMKENFRKIDRQISDTNFYNPDDF